MRCIAVVEAERPGLDSVILWDDGLRLVAFAYLDGQVMMTRPLSGESTDAAVDEVREAFQISSGQLTRVTDWHDASIRIEPITPTSHRW